MKILTHRELESKNQLLPLLDHAFGWLYNPRTFEEFIKIDPRLKDSPVGFCAVDNGRIVGYVGVMDLSTQTLDGDVEDAGGICGVATLPSHVRKGASMTLMNRAHEHLREKDYRFSFLVTSRYLVAYAMYRKLGYMDLLERPSAHKVLKLKRAKFAVEEKSTKLDLDRLFNVYNACMKNKTGFVIRDKAYITMLKKTEGFTGKDCVFSEEGYALFKRNVGGTWTRATWIRELVASNTKEMDKLLELVEVKAKDLILDRAVMDKTLLHVYKSRGYMIQKRSHSVMMVKPLATNASFKQVYGNQFYLTGLDFF